MSWPPEEPPQRDPFAPQPRDPFAPQRDPFAPPRTDVPGGDSGGPTGPLTNAYLLTTVGSWVLGFAFIFMTSWQKEADQHAWLVWMPLVFMAVFLASPVIGLVWLHRCWSLLPPDARVNRAGRRFTPAEAVVLNFVPCFNLYWVFVVTRGLCEAIDLRLEQTERAPAAPHGLATAAAAAQLVPYCNVLVAPWVWYSFMRAVDRVLPLVVGDGTDGGAGREHGSLRRGG